jgi:diacylglycerol kinase
MTDADEIVSNPVATTRVPPSSPDLESRLAEWGDPEPWSARAGRRDAKAKLGAGLCGLKHAFRGDSSFFAHAYRGLLIALAAAMLGVGPSGWIFLVLAAALVLISELGHSAIDTLARSLGDPDAPGPKVAREIASAGVLVAVVVFAAVSVTVLVLKLNELLGWWH